jgi:hypothetical protein
MSINLDELPDEARDEIERLRSVNASMGAYLKLVEGALLAAWSAGEPARRDLMSRAVEELDAEQRRLRDAWELVGEIVLRVPDQR